MTASSQSSPFKVLIAHHRWWYPTAVSGADIANYEFAKKMIKQGVQVRVHGIIPPGISKRTEHLRYNTEGVQVCLVKSEFIKQLRAGIREFEPDIVLTSCPEPNCGTDDITRMVETIARFEIPVVLYAHDINNTLPLFADVKDQLARVVTNSHFMADHISKNWSVECDVVYPVPEWGPIDAIGSTGAFITFFNPTPDKGLGIAHPLVTTYFKDRPFLFVEGFIDPRAHEISLSRSGNLVHARSSPDVATIYMMTRLVIIPSQWQEPFGRIALEAMYNRIPVIASRTGGLIESVGPGGILIDNYSDVDVWVSAILRLDDYQERRRMVEAGKRYVKKFSLDQEVDRLLGILKRASLK